MKQTIQCQEEVSNNKRSSRRARPESFPHLEGEYHQCTFAAKYKIGSIGLYVCRSHASGIDKKQLIEI